MMLSQNQYRDRQNAFHRFIATTHPSLPVAKILVNAATFVDAGLGLLYTLPLRRTDEDRVPDSARFAILVADWFVIKGIVDLAACREVRLDKCAFALMKMVEIAFADASEADPIMRLLSLTALEAEPSLIASNWAIRISEIRADISMQIARGTLERSTLSMYEDLGATAPVVVRQVIAADIDFLATWTDGAEGQVYES